MGALVDIGTLPLPVVIAINLACRAAALTMAWPAIRQAPPRSRWIRALSRYVKE